MLLQGHHTYNLGHLVVLHDGEIVDWFIKDQWESGGWRATDPLDVQASCGGLLRTTVVYCLDLKKHRSWTKYGYLSVLKFMFRRNVK